MFLTSVNFAKKPKSRILMVLMKSLVSDHNRISFRDKASDEREILEFDPYVGELCVYREVKKIRTMRGSFNLTEHRYTPQFDDDGNLIKKGNRKIKIPSLD